MPLAFGGQEERSTRSAGRSSKWSAGTTVVLRGSAVTGQRWKDGAPFDADGPGTSDLDLTLVGDGRAPVFNVTGFFVPGVHSRPLSDEDPDIAPELVPLRERLMDDGRPAGQHPGVARHRDAVSRRPARPALPRRCSRSRTASCSTVTVRRDVSAADLQHPARRRSAASTRIAAVINALRARSGAAAGGDAIRPTCERLAEATGMAEWRAFRGSRSAS